MYAAAGLLANRPATTHWASLDQPAELDPLIDVRRDDRFVDDGDVITAPGVSAGIDMALHLVVRLAGSDLARQVGRYIQYDPAPPVCPLRRSHSKTFDHYLAEALGLSMSAWLIRCLGWSSFQASASTRGYLSGPTDDEAIWLSLTRWRHREHSPPMRVDELPLRRNVVRRAKLSVPLACLRAIGVTPPEASVESGPVAALQLNRTAWHPARVPS